MLNFIQTLSLSAVLASGTILYGQNAMACGRGRQCGPQTNCATTCCSVAVAPAVNAAPAPVPAKAHEICGMAEEQCLAEHGDSAVIGDCCSEMWHEIDAAHAETAKLLNLLKIEKLEPPKKVTPKK